MRLLQKCVRKKSAFISDSAFLSVPPFKSFQAQLRHALESGKFAKSLDRAPSPHMLF
jgi:hypothetical protein